MNKKILEKEIFENLQNTTKEIKRIFHGRGNFFDGYNFLTIDSMDNLLLLSIYEKIDAKIYEDILNIIEKILKIKDYEIVLIQHRYKKDDIYETIKGKIPQNFVAYENGLKYHINFKNQNIGLFFDMKNGRKYIQDSCKDKNVLNLFAYTCAFSVSAKKGKAKNIVNVDMSKSALSIGRKNHHLNNFDTKNVHFMPYNILKSWSRIKKQVPYDIIIIDPPSFQKGSFEVSKDYEKIIKKLDTLASDDCIVLSCLNAPELQSDFIIDIFTKYAPIFKYEKQLENPFEFKTNNHQKALKNIVFRKYNQILDKMH